MGSFFTGKQKTQTSTSTSEPWAEQKPYLTYGFHEARNIYDRPGPEFYPESTVAPFSPDQEQAFTLARQRGLLGNETMNAAEGFSQDVLGGDYLNNPYDDQVFDNIQSKVMPAVRSQFMTSGRTGSGLEADTMTRALTEAYAPYASSQWESGLGRMERAAGMAPMFAQDDYQDIGALEAVGGQQQQLAQREMDDARTRWDFYQDLPSNKLNEYLGMISGNYGGTTTSAQPYYQPGLFSTLLGAGATGLGAYFGSRPPSLY